MFFHPIYSRRDHVAVYVVRDFRQTAPPRAEPRDRGARLLPARCAARRTPPRGTRARIAEVLTGKPAAERW